jgi:hypothetical protein
MIDEKKNIYEKIKIRFEEEFLKFYECFKNIYNLSPEDKDYVEKTKRNFEEENKKEHENKIAKFSEMVFLLKGEDFFGKETKIFLSSFYDDFKNGIDLIGKIPIFLFNKPQDDKENKEEKEEVNNFIKKEYQFVALGIDVTFGNHEALENKMRHLKNNLLDTYFISPKYFPFNEEKTKNTNVKMPHFIIYLPVKTLEDLIKEFNDVNIRSVYIHKTSLDILKNKFKDVYLGFIPFAVYNQLLIQINAWQKKLKEKIEAKENDIKELNKNMERTLLKLEKVVSEKNKVYLLSAVGKIRSAIVNENKILLDLKSKFNDFELIKSHIYLIIENKISEEQFNEEDKEEIKKEIYSLNKDFAYNFLKEIKYNKKSIPREREVKKLIEENIYLP